MKAQFRSICVPALLAGVLLNCGKDGQSIKVGGLVPLTGEESPFGASSRKGYDMAIKEWNERGGLLGRPVQLILRDDQGPPSQHLETVSRLIDHDQVVALLGANVSQVSLVAAPIAQAAGIPMISPLSSHPQLTAVGDCIYRICCTDRDQGVAGAVFAYQDLKARKAACIFDRGDAFPAEIARVFKSEFTSLGGRVVAFVGHASGAADYKPHLARVLSARPDIIYLPDFYQDAVLIAKEARAQGFKGALVGGDGWDSPGLLLPAGRELDAGFFTTNFSPDEDRPIVKDFVRKYRALHQEDPDAFAALSYDAGNVLFDAIRRAGATSGPALKAALLDTDFPGVSGPIRFDAQRNPFKLPAIIEIKGGKRLYRGKIVPN